MNIVFMGTPDFAVGTLETLINSEHDVTAVVTQPDKPKGRGGKMMFTPVKDKIAFIFKQASFMEKQEFL